MLSFSLAGQNLPEAPAPTRPQPFLQNRINLILAGGDLAARVSDAASTRYAITHDSCEETGDLGFSSIAHHDWSQYSYSSGFAAFNMMLSRELWSISQRRHSRALRLASRSVLIVDIGLSVYAAAHNLGLPERKPGMHQIRVTR